jgi:molybdopterin synthase sulfur carrier subunit
MRIRLSCGRDELWLEYPLGQEVRVQDVLEAARSRRPDLHNRWCDASGELRAGLGVFVNGEHVRYRDGLATRLHDGNEVYVIPLVTGG